MRVATYKRLAEQQVIGWRVEIEALEGARRTLIHSASSAGRAYPKNTPLGWQRWQQHVVRLVAPIDDAALAFANASGGMRVLLLVISTGIRFWVSSEIVDQTGEVTLDIILPEDSIGENLTIIPSFRAADSDGKRSALDLWAPGKIVVDFVGQQSWFPVESRKFTREGQFINVELPDPSECTLIEEECPLMRPLGENVRIQIDMESEEWLRLEKSLYDSSPSDASHHALTRICGFVVAAIRGWEAELDKKVLENLIGINPPKLAANSFGWFVRALHDRLDPSRIYRDEDTVFWLQLVSRLIAPNKMEGNNR